MTSVDSFGQLRQDLITGAKEQEALLSFKGEKLKLNSADDSDTKKVVTQISKAPVINALELTGNTVGAESAAAVAKCLNSRKEMKRALWSDIFTGRLKTEIPPALRSLTGALITAGAQMTELDLSDNAFGAQGVEGFEVFLRSPAAYSLKVLKLNNNGLGIAGGKLLAKCLIDCHKASSSAGNPLRLTTFISGRNRLENAGATALAEAFEIIGTLERVEMIQNGIYHPGITALCNSFGNNPNLQTIDLSDNTFTLKGAEAMASILPSLTQLEVLCIGDCLLKTNGVTLILEALESHYRLRILNISGNEIGKSAVPAIISSLKNKSNLEKVELSSNQFGSGLSHIEKFVASLDHGDEVFVIDDDEGSDEESDANNQESSDHDEPGEAEEDNYGAADPECDQEVTTNNFPTFTSPLRRMTPLAAAIDQIERVPKPKPQLDITIDRIINLRSGAPKAVLDQLGEALDDPDCVVAGLLKLSQFITRKNEKTMVKLITPCADALLEKAFDVCDAVRFCNILLPHTGLLKIEDKACGDRELFGLLTLLNHSVVQPYFPGIAKSVLKFVIEQRIDFVKKEKQLILDLKSNLPAEQIAAE